MCKKMGAAILLSTFLLTMSPMQQAWAASTVQVTLPSFNVTLNGKSTGNEYSKYPLIVYKDITYFSLTWRFAAEEFGWKYQFDQKDGLVIKNDKVKLENPEEWEFHKFMGAGTLGRGSSLRIQVSGPVSAILIIKN